MVDGTIGADGYGVTAGKAYVAKLDATKAVMWTKKFDTTTFSVVRGVAVDKDGNIIVAGSFSGSMTVDSATLVSDAVDIFLLKLDPLGAVTWSKPLQGANTQNAFGVAVDSEANIYITGATDKPVDFGGGTSANPSSHDVFIASYAPDNTYRWHDLFVNAGPQFGRAITTASNGDVLVIGDTSDVTDLGGGTMMKDKSADIFVARYTKADGSYVWAKLYGKGMMTDQFGRGIAMTNDDHVLITGGYAGGIDWGGGVMSTATGTSDVYVAKLDGMTGDHLAHAQGGKSGTSTGTAIAADASGNVTVFGHFNGSIDFGGQSVASSPSSYDTFLVKLNPTDWKPIWTKTYGKAGHQYGWDVALKPDGTTIVGGGFNQELEVPPMAIVPTSGGMDLFSVLSNP